MKFSYYFIIKLKLEWKNVYMKINILHTDADVCFEYPK